MRIMTEKRKDICRKYETAGLKPEIIRIVASISKYDDNEICMILDMVLKCAQKAANVQRMLDCGIPMALIMRIFPYLDQPADEVIEVRREKFGM